MQIDIKKQYRLRGKKEVILSVEASKPLRESIFFVIEHNLGAVFPAITFVRNITVINLLVALVRN